MDFNQLRKSSSGVEFLNLDGACEAEETILREMLFSQQDDEQLSSLFQLKSYPHQSYHEQQEVEAVQAVTQGELIVNTSEMEGVIEHMGVHGGTPVAISANGPIFMSPQNHEMNPAMMPGMQAMRGYYSQQPISVVHGGNGTNVGQPHGVVNQPYPHVSVGIPGGQQQYLMMQANTGQYVNLPPMHYVHAHRHGGHAGNFVQGPSSGKYANGPRKSHSRSSDRRGRPEQEMVNFPPPQYYQHQQNIYTANVAYYNQHMAPTLTGSPIIMTQKQLPMYYGGAHSYGSLVHASATSEQPSEMQVNGEESSGPEESEGVSIEQSEATQLTTSMENVMLGQEQPHFTTENGELNVIRTSSIQSAQVSSTNVIAEERNQEPIPVPDNSNIKCPSGNKIHADQVESNLEGANTATANPTTETSTAGMQISPAAGTDTVRVNGTLPGTEAVSKGSDSVEKTDFPALDSSASAVVTNGDNRTSATVTVKSWASVCRRPNQGASGAPASASIGANVDSTGPSQALPNQLGFNGSGDLYQKNVLQSINTSAPTEAEEVQLANLISNAHEFDGSSLSDSTDPQAIRLGEFLVNYQLDHHATALTPRGLTNQSNFCYINATLQALMACPPFVNLFRSMREIGLGKNPSRATPIIQSVFDFVAEFEPLARGTANKRDRRNESCVTGSNLEPTGIRKVLGLLDGSTYKIEGRQQDAEEFLSHLLNGLHDEMIKVMEWYQKSKVPSSSHSVVVQNGSPADAEEYPDDDDPDHWQVMGPKNKGCLTRKTNISKSPISEMLFGQLCSALHRANSVKSATLQPFFTLPLDIQSDNVKSLRDALEGLTSKEEVTGVLSQSGHETEAWRQLSLEELPMILILHLKRFVYDKSGQKINKVDKILEFGVDLEIAKDLLSTNVRGKCSPKQRQYKLFAVVYHDGEEAYKGHYVADCFHPSGGSSWGSVGWLRYDDVSVKPVVESAMLNSQPPRVPYLLYYRRVDTLNQSQTQPPRKDR